MVEVFELVGGARRKKLAQLGFDDLVARRACDQDVNRLCSIDYELVSSAGSAEEQTHMPEQLELVRAGRLEQVAQDMLDDELEDHALVNSLLHCTPWSAKQRGEEGQATHS